VIHFRTIEKVRMLSEQIAHFWALRTLGVNGAFSLFQVALCPAQVVLLHFQFAYDHLKAVELDAL
jgi:hypothetical protein